VTENNDTEMYYNGSKALKGANKVTEAAAVSIGLQPDV